MALPLSSLSVPVVRRYKYLGTILDDSSTFRSEVLFRASSARKAIFRARARLRDTCLTYAARIALVHALIVSRLLYGAESWPLLPEDHLSLLYQPLVFAL
eukprot:12470324-Prorocentrum_lima.AAC.1